MWDRKELKQRGRAAFKANYWKCVLAAFLLALFVTGGVSSGSRVTYNLNNSSQSTQDVQLNAGEIQDIQGLIDAIGKAENASPDDISALNELVDALQTDPETQAAAAGIAAIFLVVLLLLLLLGSAARIFVFGPLEVGCQGFFARNTEAPAQLDALGSGFHPYWRTVGAMFLRDLFLILWSLLLIVPGIVKAYSYRMTPYILAEYPEMRGREAITLSRQMMAGQKWRAFVLDLSFIGWGLLSALTLGLLGLFYVHPYRYCTNAELYRELKAMR